MSDPVVFIYTDDCEQVSLLEVLIAQLGISYRVRPCSVSVPYITVHGVPLDYDHALIWCEEQRRILEDEQKNISNDC